MIAVPNGVDLEKFLFPELEIVESGVRSGPWSALLMFLAYWLGVICSFGFKKATPFLAHIFMLVLGPLKYLDLLFARFPGAEDVSAHLYIIGRKNNNQSFNMKNENEQRKRI